VGDILSVVGRITADLSKATTTHREGDLSSLLAFAIERYGLGGKPIFMPLFVGEDMLDKRDEKDGATFREEIAKRGRSFSSYNAADVLFGTAGAGRIIAESVQDFTIDHAIDSLSSSTDAVASAALGPALDCFDAIQRNH
jgi:hypothetical protein